MRFGHTLESQKRLVAKWVLCFQLMCLQKTCVNPISNAVISPDTYNKSLPTSRLLQDALIL